jgi:hypothetical protein
MPMCEKCWSDAHSGWPYCDVAAQYSQLLDERKDNQCTPEQQAGPDARECPTCKRATVHQHCHVCVVCGLEVPR